MSGYDVAGTGLELRLNLKCASDGYNFDLASEVQYRGGAISGSWTEPERLRGPFRDAPPVSIEAAARGQNFSANLSLTTRGSRQTGADPP